MARLIVSGSTMRKCRRDAGFTYLAVLFLVAISGVVLALTGVIWSTAQRRDKERELLYIGNEFRTAIASYYERTPGTVKRYPNSFDDLLKDNRHLVTLRHLRRVYLDPITSTREWGIVRAPDGGMMGIFSLSTADTIKHSGFLGRDAVFEKAKTYSEWRFLYEPQIKFSADRGK